MIIFLLKGLIRDRSRSIFPILVVIAGVILTVIGHGWVKGAEQSFTWLNAAFDTGHVKIMSRAYAEEADQVPNDLALTGIEEFIQELRRDFPGLLWAPRIRFGGLLDIPDEQGETRDQGPVAGLAVDFFSERSPEKNILDMEKALVRGRLPEKQGEIVISDELAQRLSIRMGETATLISSTMYGSLAAANFTVVGTIRFGVTAMDRGTMVADISDIQKALDMDDAAGETLGIFTDFIYDDTKADEVKSIFNSQYEKTDDEFAPTMLTLSDQGMGDMLELLSYFSGVIILVFVAVMSIVLWNTGLMGSLRRYGEIGVRIAIGESKGHVYRTMIGESLMIGAIGSVIGTAIGLSLAYYLQVKGLDISSMMKNASALLPDVLRARVTPFSYVIGFIPGLVATFLGTAMSGIGIYKRQTAQLSKELEA